MKVMTAESTHRSHRSLPVKSLKPSGAAMDRLGTDWGAEAGCVDGTEEEGLLRGESGLDMDCCTPDIDEMR